MADISYKKEGRYHKVRAKTDSAKEWMRKKWPAMGTKGAIVYIHPDKESEWKKEAMKAGLTIENE